MSTQRQQQKPVNKQDARAKKVRQMKHKIRLVQSHVRNMLAASKQ